MAKQGELLSVYEAAKTKGVTPQTVKNALQRGDLKAAQTVDMGDKRKGVPLIARAALEKWQAQSRSRTAEKSVATAADLLGISREDALTLRRRWLDSGKQERTKIQIQGA